MKKQSRILVIRLGALGDLVLCCQAFQDIRQAHPDAEIALLTMPAFAGFARQMPWFDTVLTDDRAAGWRIDRWLRLVLAVRRFAPTIVYDLQGKFRQTVLYGLLGGPLGPAWSGAAPFCRYPRAWPPKPTMHFSDFIRAQLENAKVPKGPVVDMKWLDAPIEGIDPAVRYVVMIPGCGAGRDYKRWPAEHYAALARRLQGQNIATLLVGTALDSKAIAAVHALAPQAIDITGRTSLGQLAHLARRAVAVIGNDTGPTHLAAAVGAPVLALFSGAVNPVWSAPRGRKAKNLQGQPIGAIKPDEVLLALARMLDKNPLEL